MKTNSRRYRRHRNPEAPEKKETPFFTRSTQAVQAKADAFFQPKLAVGQPGDKFEQEADAVAEQVVNKQPANGSALQRKEISPVQAKAMPEPEKEKEKPVQKKGDSLKKEEDNKLAAPETKKEEQVQKKDDPAAEKEGAAGERKVAQEEEAPLQMKEEEGKEPAAEAKKEEEIPVQKKEEMEKREEKGNEVPVMTKRQDGGMPSSGHPGIEQRLQQRSGGAGLSPDVRNEMSRAIGADFGGVRIHTGDDAVKMNRELGAQAFTHGNDIYFNSGKYDPATSNGKRLLAHELTHVVQQGAAPAAAEKAPTPAKTAPGVQRDTSTPLPKEAKVDKKSKVASLQSGEFSVKIKPDRKAQKGEDVKPNGAVTNGDIDASATYKTENGQVTGVTIKKELTIQTVYGVSADPAADSEYGRGHIKKDKDAGNRSLRFHEGCHGQDFIDYVKTHPYPTIVIEGPISMEEYNTLFEQWKVAAAQYQADMEAHSKTHTDDVTDEAPAKEAE
jgi:hypothetical protein